MLRWMRSQLDNVVASTAYNGAEMGANCPFCVSRVGKPDVKRHMYVSKIKTVAYCQRCEWAGGWLRLIMEVEGCTYTDAIHRVAGKMRASDFATVVAEFSEEEPEDMWDESFGETFDDLQLLGTVDSALHRMAVRYLKNRNVPKRYLQSGMFGVRPGELRVYVQVAENYWQGRSIIEALNPKYKNPKRSIEDNLGLWDTPAIRDDVRAMQGAVHIVEGMFSGMALLRRSKPVAVLLGKKATTAQLERLLGFSGRLRVCLDHGAEDNAFELAQTLLRHGKSDVDVAILPYGDPEDCEEYQVHGADELSRIRYELGV